MTTIDILDELARGIAQALDERGKRQLAQIRRLIDCLGARAVLDYAEKAKRADAQASFLVVREHRFRTLGGIFYQFVRDDPTLTDDVRQYCFRYARWQHQETIQDKKEPPGANRRRVKEQDNTSRQEAL